MPFLQPNQLVLASSPSLLDLEDNLSHLRTVFTHWTPFLSPNKPDQSTKGT